MIAPQIFIAAYVAAASATSLVAREDAYLASLLKRQEPGTPAYNCHDNCGSAITLSRTSNPCDNAAFVADYNNCLKCSGPDNYNIWRYYGNTLSTAGASCGFDTEPLAGKQEDVPEAGSTGVASSAAPVQTSVAVQSSAGPSAISSLGSLIIPVSSSDAAPTSSRAAATTEAPTSKTFVPSTATPSAPLTTVDITAVLSATTGPASIMNVTLTSPVSGVPSPSTNSSASFTASAPAEVTTNAAPSHRAADVAFAGIIGVIFFGVLAGM